MANEFIARRGLIVLTAGASVTGGLAVDTTISAQSITGSLQGNGSQVTGVISSSYAVTSSHAVSSSAATSITFQPISSSYAGTDWSAINNKPTVVSSSVQINTGSFSGTFVGNGAGITNVISSSYATTSSAATSITFQPLTASYALTAGTTGGGVTGQGVNNYITKWISTSTVATSSLQDDNTRITTTVPFTASAFQGNGAGITGVISSSYAVTASYAINAQSVNFSTGSYTGSFTGEFTGLGSGITGVISASHANTDWVNINNKPTVVSSSAQVVGLISGQPIAPSTISASAITVTGPITAQSFNTQFVSSSIIYQSGSTKFGDTADDVMSVTGTLAVSGTTVFNGPVTFNSGLQSTIIAGALYSTGSITANIGTTVVATVATASYDMAHFQYIVKNTTPGSTRTGVVMAVWSGSSIEYTDTSTNDIGSTSDISFTADVLGDTARLKAVVSAINGWTVKTIIQAI